MEACRLKLEKVCLALIEKGCDLNVHDRDGFSAIEWATRLGLETVTKIIRSDVYWNWGTFNFMWIPLYEWKIKGAVDLFHKKNP